MYKKKRLISLFILAFTGLFLFILGYWIAKPQSSILLRIDASTLMETAQASPVPQNTIAFSIRTNKNCYFMNEPIQVWAELANLSNDSIIVLKTLRFFTGNQFQDVTPIVDGKPNKAQRLVLNKATPVDDYVTLLSRESTITYIPNFLDLVHSLNGNNRYSIGQYDFALLYQNLVPYRLNQIILTDTGVIYYEMLADKVVWTGIIESNHIIVTIVDNPDKCGMTITSQDTITNPEPTLNWSR